MRAVVYLRRLVFCKLLFYTDRVARLISDQLIRSDLDCQTGDGLRRLLINQRGRPRTLLYSALNSSVELAWGPQKLYKLLLKRFGCWLLAAGSSGDQRCLRIDLPKGTKRTKSTFINFQRVQKDQTNDAFSVQNADFNKFYCFTRTKFQTQF